jgi:molybdopterin/thiamine biosynthesis adenylyltransferase/rhodanese-related sulfurtransferase
MQDLQNSERYSRHLNLKGFGLAGQQKLLNAKVLVVGAGGLGCPVLQYLTAAGVGTIGIADDDLVSLSNLQRQVLYSVDDLGLSKAKQAAIRLRRLNPDVNIQAHAEKVSSTNAMALFAGYDVIVDGTDNFASRYLINDACVLLNKPLVFAAVYQYEGQLAIFNVADDAGLITSYRDLFPVPPTALEAPDCNATGVLGVLPGVIGVMQATEVIKLIAGIGKPLVNQLLTFNSLTAESYTININAHPQAQALMPGSAAEFQELNYERLCAADSLPIAPTNDINFENSSILDPLHTKRSAVIDASTFEDYQLDPDTLIVDVREFGEGPRAKFPNVQIPLANLKDNYDRMDKAKIVVFCRVGLRSVVAASQLQEHFGSSKEIYSLQGGILGLDND